MLAIPLHWGEDTAAVRQSGSGAASKRSAKGWGEEREREKVGQGRQGGGISARGGRGP